MNADKPVIGVIGAGRMGTGIAQFFAYAGYRVELIDIKERSNEEVHQVFAQAAQQINGNMSLLASLGIITEQAADRMLKRICYHDASSLKDILPKVEVAFEAVPEVLDLKEEALDRISTLVSENTLIASTTSTFLADALAPFIVSPQRFMNTHWLNPAYLIPLVEVSPCSHTAPENLLRMTDMLESAGKIPVRCSPSPGFIVPRIQALAMNEAARLVEEGVATPEDIDKAVRVGFGLRFAVLGLLEFIDWGGGDILYYADNYLKDNLHTDRFEPPSIITENMKNGNIGLKTGRGFYDFSDKDVTAYQRETIKKFIDLLLHLGLFPKAGDE